MGYDLNRICGMDKAQPPWAVVVRAHARDDRAMAHFTTTGARFKVIIIPREQR